MISRNEFDYMLTYNSTGISNETRIKIGSEKFSEFNLQ